MKTKFVTSIYSDLYGTVFGGRQSRGAHYRYSLLSLLKMNNCDFICYTSNREIEDLKNFFYVLNNIDESKLKFVEYDLEKTKKTNLIKLYKDYESSKLSDRCIEIQYCKFEWLRDNIDGNYDYYFWIDAGLSHCGLIPNRYLTNDLGYRSYYESSLFNDNFLSNLLKFTDDKIFIIGKENFRNYWSGTVNPKHFKVHSTAYHVIGGIFGGKMDNVIKFTELFDNDVDLVTNHDGRLYHEEDIMTLIWRNNEEMFNIKYFDTWWHENERIPGLDIIEHLKKNKSFYKILEELNSYE